MTPDRRRFLRQLVSGSAGLALGAELDLDRLLWIPKAMVTVPAMPVSLVGDTITVRLPPFLHPDAFTFRFMTDFETQTWVSKVMQTRLHV